MVKCRIAVCLAFAVISACGMVPAAFAGVDTRYDVDEIMIPYVWQYHLGDLPGAESPDLADADWPTWLTPWKFIHADTPSTPPGYEGVIWYRMHFLAPEKDLGTGLVCELKRVLGTPELYINGRKLPLQERRGAFSADVPLDLLRRDRPNVLALRITGNEPGDGRVVGPLNLVWQNLALRLKNRVRVRPLPTDANTGQAGARLEFRNAQQGDDDAWRFKIEVIDYFGRTVHTSRTSRPTGKTAWSEDLSFACDLTKPYRVRVIDEQTGETVTRYVRCDKMTGDRQRILLSGPAWKMLAVKEDAFGALPGDDAAWESCTIPPIGDQYAMWGYDCGGAFYDRPMQLACQPFMKDKCHRAWFTRKFLVPESFTGKQILIDIGASWGATRVVVNGEFIKESVDSFTPIVCDITKVARPGKENTILLAVADLTSLLNPDRLGTIRSSSGVYRRRPLRAFLGVVGGWGTMSYTQGYRFGGPWQDVNLVARPLVRVDDVFVVSQVKEKRLRAEVTLANDSSEAVAVTVDGSVWKEDRRECELGKKPLTVGAGKTGTVVLEGPVTLSLWSPASPTLYRLALHVTGKNGKLLDACDTRFGYRDIRTDGARFKLNDETYNVRRMSGSVLKICDTPHGLAQYMGYVKNAGRNLWRVQHGQCQFLTPYWLDVADETGMPLQVEMAWLYRYQDIDSPIFWKNMRAHAAATAHLYRNRPSVLMYALANEVQHSPDRTATLPFSVRDAVRDVDPTRLIAFDDDDDYLRGGMDFITMHYPYPLGKHFLWPDDAFWWQTPMPVVFNRAPGVFDWKRDRPVVVGEMSDNAYAEAPDGVSTILGDKAYLRRPQSWIEAWLDGSRMLEDGARLSGVAGTNMWMTQWRDAFVYDALKPPVCAIAREYDNTFYSGETVKRTLSVLNDTLKTENLELRWRLRTPSKVIESGEVSKRLAPGGREDVTIDLTLPEVDERSSVAFEWEVFDGDALRDWQSRAYTVFPRRAVSAKAPVAMYDPSGRTAKALGKAGVATRPVDKLTADAIADVDCLWIGENALSENADYDPAVLQDFVSKGGRLVVLRHDAPFVAPTPARMTPDARHESNQAWVRFPDHPILAGLARDDFTYWRARPQKYPPHTSKGPREKAEPTWPPNHRVCTQAYVKPSQGNFRILLDSGGPDGLVWTPLVEMPVGKGSAVLCQLTLADVLGQEPVADRLVANMIAWADGPVTTPAKTLRLLAKETPEIAEALEAAGIQRVPIDHPVTASDLPPGGVVLVGGRETLCADESKTLADWMKRGGTLWLHDLEQIQKTTTGGIPTEGLVAWWKLDANDWAGRPGDVKDATGQGNDLTAKGSDAGLPKTVGGVFKRAAAFDGKGQYLFAPADREDLMVGQEDFTLAAWVKSNDLAARCGILGMAVADYSSTCYGFYQRPTETGGAAMFQFVVNGHPDKGDPWGFIKAPAHPGWHHLCGVRKGGKTLFYIDGVLAVEASRGVLNPDRKGDFFMIGASDANSQMTPGGFFNGLVDDVRLYKGVAFTPEQVTALYEQSQKEIDSLESFKALLPETIALESDIPPSVELRDNHGLGSGLSNYELWWRRGRFMWSDRTQAIADMAKDVVVTGKDTGARIFTDPAVLVEWQVGKGKLVVDQLRWQALAGQPQAMRVLNTMATNLGCASVADKPETSEVEYFPLNLQAYCNRALGRQDVMPDRPPFIDDGDNDLRELPRGLQEFGGVAFLIHEALALKSENLPFLPTESPAIQVGRKAHSVCFLHAAVGAKKGEIGRYVVTYADGRVTELPIVVGYNVQDWWAPGKDIFDAKLAWSGKNPAHEPVCVYLMEWVNTHPDKEIATIRMKSAAGPVTPVLIGLSTAGLKPGAAPQGRYRTFHPLDLSAVANRSLKTGGPHGWPDVEGNDLRAFETGDVVLGGIPAQVSASPKSCLILETPRLTKLREQGVATGAFPKEATIPVGAKADAIFFLQTSTYTRTGGSILYDVNYQDGASDTISIKGGKQLWDWWKEVDFFPPRITLAWQGANAFHWPVHVWWYEWRNPHPDKPIRDIRVRTVDEVKSGIPVLLGVTLADR